MSMKLQIYRTENQSDCRQGWRWVWERGESQHTAARCGLPCGWKHRQSWQRRSRCPGKEREFSLTEGYHWRKLGRGQERSVYFSLVNPKLYPTLESCVKNMYEENRYRIHFLLSCRIQTRKPELQLSIKPSAFFLHLLFLAETISILRYSFSLALATKFRKLLLMLMEMIPWYRVRLN